MLLACERAEHAFDHDCHYNSAGSKKLRFTGSEQTLDLLMPDQSPASSRQRACLRGAFRFEQLGQQEGEVDRLLGVEPRIADRVVAVLEIGVGDHARAARALGDVLAGHLQMDAAAVGALGAVNREEGLHLRQDAVERPGLVAGLRRDGVAVHRIARPHHDLALALDRAHHAPATGRRPCRRRAGRSA